VSTLAGLYGVAGSADGTGTSALFNEPQGIALDYNGEFGLVVRAACACSSASLRDATMRSILQSDWGNQALRRVVVSSGVVSTVAGTPGVSGFVDGPATAAAFHRPLGVALSAAGDVAIIVR